MKQACFDKQGYSLIEILIVVILMGVVMSIAFSSFSTVLEKQRAEEGEQTLYIIYTRFKAAEVEYGWKCLGFAAHVDVTMPPSENFESPSYVCFGEPPNPPAIPLRIDVVRKGGLYTLSLDTNNTLSPMPIICSSATAGLCAKLGY